MLRRRFMMKRSSGGKYSFSFVANFQNNSTKNILNVTAGSGGGSITDYGMGFCLYLPLNDTAFNNEKFVLPISETENNCTMTITVTTPNNQTYTTTIFNALNGSEKGVMSYGYSLVGNYSVKHNSTSSSVIDYLANSETVRPHAEVTSMGTTNYNLSGSSSAIKEITIGESDQHSNVSVVNGSRWCESNLADGDYLFEVTISGVELSEVYVSNYACANQVTSGKSTYYASSANRSKVRWVSGDSIFIDNMYKENGVI